MASIQGPSADAIPHLALFLRTNEQWLPIIRIPLAKVLTYAVHPLRWLRYLGWCLYGVRGQLCIAPAQRGLDENELDGTTDLRARYYYVSDRPAYLLDDNILEFSHVEGRPGNKHNLFQDKLISRDGNCVVRQQVPTFSLEVSQCVAAHLIPHAKEPDILRLQRVRKVPPAARLSEIDDPRNGVLVWAPFHSGLDEGQVAFLLAPNIYMGLQDITYIPAPQALPTPPIPPSRRDSTAQEDDPKYGELEEPDGGWEDGYNPQDGSILVFQHLTDPPDGFWPIAAPHGTQAAFRSTTAVPGVLPVCLHLAYAAAIVNLWGTPEVRGVSRPGDAFDFLIGVHQKDR
ncbi:hypothetical protein FB451DRAFT_1438220 [Mycena latifolia]|nr:hypothetical protein FB451DRAFT_1438220 [Mycena latifolia]